jgi:hypothetical protein
METQAPKPGTRLNPLRANDSFAYFTVWHYPTVSDSLVVANHRQPAVQTTTIAYRTSEFIT